MYYDDLRSEHSFRPFCKSVSVGQPPRLGSPVRVFPSRGGGCPNLPTVSYYHSHAPDVHARRIDRMIIDQHCKLSRVKRPTARATIPRTQSAPNSRLRQAPPSRASTIGRKCHLYATCTSFIVLVPLPGFLHVNTQKNGRRVPGGRAAGWQAEAAGRRRLGGNGNMDRVSGT